GAYTAGILTARYHWETLPALLAAALLPALVALVIGRPALKLRQQYLALATLGFGILVYIFFNEARGLTGGPSGFTGIPYLSVGGFQFDRDREFYYFVWLVVALVLAGANNLAHSRVGRALQAIRDSEVAAESIGIDVAELKLRVFVFSAFLAGLAGGFYAFYVTFISPSPFGFHASILFVLMAVVGGLGSIWGPPVGVGLIVALSEALRWVVPKLLPEAGGEFEIVFFGVILVLVVLLRPEGLCAVRRPVTASPAAEREEGIKAADGNRLDQIVRRADRC
ncbi:MAG: branched-chain amino acid ABC transporter permease, partial [Peptococcaceae bacterium]